MLDLDITTDDIDLPEYKGRAVVLADSRDGDVIRYLTPEEATDLAHRLLAAAEPPEVSMFGGCKDCMSDKHGEPVPAEDEHGRVGYGDGLGYCPCCRYPVYFNTGTGTWKRK